MNEQIWCSFRSYWIRISHKICDLLKTNLWYGGKTHNSYGRTTQSFGLDLEVNSYSIHSEVFQRVKINCLLGLRELFSTIDEEKKILEISEVYSENFSMRSMKHVQFSRKNSLSLHGHQCPIQSNEMWWFSELFVMTFYCWPKSSKSDRNLNLAPSYICTTPQGSINKGSIKVQFWLIIMGPPLPNKIAFLLKDGHIINQTPYWLF